MALLSTPMDIEPEKQKCKLRKIDTLFPLVLFYYSLFYFSNYFDPISSLPRGSPLLLILSDGDWGGGLSKAIMGFWERSLSHCPGQSILRMAMYDGNAWCMPPPQNAYNNAECMHAPVALDCKRSMERPCSHLIRMHAESRQATPGGSTNYNYDNFSNHCTRLDVIVLLNSYIYFLFLVFVRLKKKKTSFGILTKKSINKQ